MAFLSGSRRQTIMTVDVDAVLWQLDTAAYDTLENELPATVSRQFRKILLRIVAAQQECEFAIRVTRRILSVADNVVNNSGACKL